MNSIEGAGRYLASLRLGIAVSYQSTSRAICCEWMLTKGFSIGEALIDTIDDLINDGRIEPQLAMKILSNFDRAIAETLAEKVKSRLTFKVGIRGKCANFELLTPLAGSSRNLPILRRRVDFSGEGRQV